MSVHQLTKERAIETSADHLLDVYEQTVDAVYRYASRLTGGNRTRTDELVQDTYLAVLERLERGDRITVETGYLIVACRHRFLDDLKAHRRRKEREHRAERLRVVGPSEGLEPDVGFTTAALAQLDADQRTALVLRYVDDLPVADVAHLLGRSVGATESLLVRGRTALRALLQQGAAS